MGFPAKTLDGKTVNIVKKDGNGNLVGEDGTLYRRSVRPLYIEPVEEYAPAAVEPEEVVEPVEAPAVEAEAGSDEQAVEDPFDFDLHPEAVEVTDSTPGFFGDGELTPTESLLEDEEEGTLGL